MSKNACIILLSMLAVGCGTDGHVDEAVGILAPENATRTNTLPPVEPAQSAEELVAAYQAVLASGDQAAIENVVCWDGVPDDKRESFLVHHLNKRIAGKATITESELRPVEDFDFERFRCSLDPTHTLVYSFEVNDGSIAGSDKKLPVGEVNGRFYFGALILK